MINFLMAIICICGAFWFGFAAAGVSAQGKAVWVAPILTVVYVGASLACLYLACIIAGVAL